MSAEYLTFTAFKIISSPSSLAGTLYSPNDNCGIGKPVDCIVRVGSAMVDVSVECSKVSFYAPVMERAK